MSDERHDRAVAPTPTSYCTTVPRIGDLLTDRCRDCGHATALHVGVDHCPVCELVDLNKQALTVHGKVVNDQYLMALLERQALRYGRTKPFLLQS
jgi:hypothetical protein